MEVFSLYFSCNFTWYICAISSPIKRKVMPSSHFTFPLFFSSLIWLLWLLRHVPCMIQLPKVLLLDGILSTWLSIPTLTLSIAWLEHNFHFKFRFIINEVGWKLWIILLIKPWSITGDQLKKQDMKYGMNLKVFW